MTNARIAALRLANEQMKMFGHDHVTDYNELVAFACFIQELEKQIAARSV